MKLSKMIEQLTELKKEHGDVNIDKIIGNLDDCYVFIYDEYNKIRLITESMFWDTDDDGNEIEVPGYALEIEEEVTNE